MWYETARLIANNNYLAKIVQKMVTETSGENYKLHYIPLQHADLKDYETFLDEQDLPQEESVGKGLEGIDFILV